ESNPKGTQARSSAPLWTFLGNHASHRLRPYQTRRLEKPCSRKPCPIYTALAERYGAISKEPPDRSTEDSRGTREKQHDRFRRISGSVDGILPTLSLPSQSLAGAIGTHTS